MKSRQLLAALCLFVVLGASAGAEPPAELRDDAADGVWRRRSLVSAALTASGVAHAGEIADYEFRWQAIVDRLPDSLRFGPDDRRAAKLLAWMHAELLPGGFQEGESRFDVLLDEGKFNCVSSAAAYVALAREIQLSTRIIRVPDHVYVEIQGPRGPLIIETTAPRAARRAAISHSAQRTLNEVQLVALIYYNRAAQAFHGADYGVAAELNLRAIQLDPEFSSARKNLLAAVNNWAVQLSAAERYAEAQALLRFGLALAPQDPTLATNHELVEQSAP